MIGVGGGGATPASGALDWFSDWRSSVGVADPALWDGASGGPYKWGSYLSDDNQMDIVAAIAGTTGPGFDNLIRIVYRDTVNTPTSQSTMIQTSTAAWSTPIGSYLFQRMYLYVTVPNGENFNGHYWHFGRGSDPTNDYIAFWTTPSPQTIAAGKFAIMFDTEAAGGGSGAGAGGYSPADLSVNTLYRVEARLYRKTATTWTPAVKIWDETAGASFAVTSDFLCKSGCVWNLELGTVDITYSGSDGWANAELGNNGSTAQNTLAGEGEFVYLGAAAIRVSTDPNDWIGAFGVGAEAA